MSWNVKSTPIAPTLTSPLRKRAPYGPPVHRFGDRAGRSPGSRVNAQLRPAFPGSRRSPVAVWTRARRLQLRGQPRIDAHSNEPKALEPVFPLSSPERPGEPAQLTINSSHFKRRRVKRRRYSGPGEPMALLLETAEGLDPALRCYPHVQRADFRTRKSFPMGRSRFVLSGPPGFGLD